ncbi:hypothetical protein MHPYR_280033 [uncultured Mycobacterium sp.]|uniref:Methyltransferase FkbM domain-containing protein n=1 Tax=uncultured Mycobacterium sp. TaxID=171292 RepID=A0A1Y5PB00_9MYCO|nr:hypothetical protein MHPYR_280033 [uncultured Mycobacterium sp.]
MDYLVRVKNRMGEKHPKSAAKLITLIGRLRSRAQRTLRVTFDGDDWVHTWLEGVRIAEVPSTLPHRAVQENMPLFFYRFEPSEGQTIVDVGAGDGTEVVAFSNLVGDKGRLICIEADPEAFRRLSKAVRIAGLTNVTLVDKAVTDQGGQVTLSQSAGPAALSNSLMVNSDGGIAVPATTLDRLLDELGIDEVDYLKMNIEGAEVPALKGFATGPRRVRNWCISCHDHQGKPETATHEWVGEWLRGNGLTVWQHEPNDERPWETYYLYARPAGPA